MADRYGAVTSSEVSPVLPRIAAESFSTPPPWPPTPRVKTAPQSARLRQLPDLADPDRAGTAPLSARMNRGASRGGGGGRQDRHLGKGNRPNAVKLASRQRPSEPPTRSTTLALWNDEDDSLEEFSEALKAVQAWWEPVEASIRSKRPERLEASLKEAHGAPYLRTVCKVRRSQSLDPEHRHSIEMEMAARLVKARAVLGKWKASVEEMRKAHRQRDADALEGALSRLANEDAEVESARRDLERWRNLSETLPDVLKDATEKKDIVRLRQAVTILREEGPAQVEGAENAQKVLDRYHIRARALAKSVGEGDASAIQVALATWDFSRDDPHAVQARNALTKRDQQKQELQNSVSVNDGPRIQAAVQAWEFCRSDEDFVRATKVLQNYTQLIAEVERLLAPPANLNQLGAITQTWAWSESDPTLKRVIDYIQQYESEARRALANKDGWMLQRVWQESGSGRVLATTDGRHETRGLRWQGMVAVNRYREATAQIRKAIRAAVDETEAMRDEAYAEGEQEEYPFSDHAELEPAADVHDIANTTRGSMGHPPAEDCLRGMVDAWTFSRDDPTLNMASSWLCSRYAFRDTHVRNLRHALTSGNVFMARHALRLAASATAPPKTKNFVFLYPPELLQAREFCVSEDAAIQAVGSMTLGASPSDLLIVGARARALDEKAVLVRMVARQIEIGRIPTLRAASRPPRVVHGVLEMVCHVVAGINPSLKDPPRDTGWRSCQRMLGNPALLIDNLTNLPDYTASGRKEPIVRARECWVQVCQEVGRPQDCTIEAVSRLSIVAGQFLRFMELLFEYVMLKEDTETVRMGVQGDGVGMDIQRVEADNKRTATLKALLLDVTEQVEVQKDEMTEDLRNSPLWFHLLCRAERSLGSHPLLAAAWTVAGGHVDDITACHERARMHAIETSAVFAVANAALCSVSKGLEAMPEVAGQRSLVHHGEKMPSQSSPSNKGQNSTEAASKKPYNSTTATIATALKANTCPVTVRRLSGEVVLNVEPALGLSMKELREQIEAVDGIAMRHQQLLWDHREVSDSATVKHVKEQKELKDDKNEFIVLVLLYKSDMLFDRVEAALEIIASCSLQDFDIAAGQNQSVSDPAVMLMYGKLACDFFAGKENAKDKPGDGEDSKEGKEPSQLSADKAFEANRVSMASLPAGPSSPSRTAQSTIMNLQAAMLDVLRAVHEVMRSHQSGVTYSGAFAVQADTPWQWQPVCETLELSSRLVRSPLVPQANLSHAVRLMQQYVKDQQAVSGDVPDVHLKEKRISSAPVPAKPNKASPLPPEQERNQDLDLGFNAVKLFVDVLHAYYTDFVPTRAHAVAASQAAHQADAAFKSTSQVLDFSSRLSSMCEGCECGSVYDVQQASYLACGQLLALAQRGMALSHPHVEFMRRAIDSAGLNCLNCPPAADPYQRLRWAENIMSIQLAPLPIVGQTLQKIARLLDIEELAQLGAMPDPPQATGMRSWGAERLMAALCWIIDPQCSCDRRWEHSRSLLSDAGSMKQMLIDWSLLKDVNHARIGRAADVLLEVWTWVASGCGGCMSFRVLFSWVSLAVAITPLALQGMRLKSVHSTIKMGLEKADSAKLEHRGTAAAKAWTSALFLLDGAAEAWWWLGSIRTASHAGKPWTDSEDGGVGAAATMHDPELDWQQGEDPFDGNDVHVYEVDVDLDKEMDAAISE